MRATSLTVRQIGPTRVVKPRWIIPSALTSSRVGARPTELAFLAGSRTDVPVSSPIAHVTRFAPTELPDPPLDAPGSRSVSYALQLVPPNELRVPGIPPAAYSPMFALARIIAPAARSRFTNSASRGGRSLA